MAKEERGEKAGAQCLLSATKGQYLFISDLLEASELKDFVSVPFNH